jgi:hypothetical protein
MVEVILIFIINYDNITSDISFSWTQIVPDWASLLDWISHFLWIQIPVVFKFFNDFFLSQANFSRQVNIDLLYAIMFFAIFRLSASFTNFRICFRYKILFWQGMFLSCHQFFYALMVHVLVLCESFSPNTNVPTISTPERASSKYILNINIRPHV